jgi:hypothetical protein
MLSAGLGIVGFSWAASPSCTELETIVLDWLGRMINLPKVFLPFNQEYASKPTAPLAPLNNNHLGTPPTPDTAFLEDYMYQNGFSSDEEEPIHSKSNGGGVILVIKINDLSLWTFLKLFYFFERVRLVSVF